jgi:hypothetical protein
MKKSVFHILLGLCFITLAACGGGGGGDGGGITPSGPTILQGVFLDSAVEGLAYSSGGQSGTTDASGTFSYEQGATITFKVGDIVLGTANAQSIMTPISLVSGAVDETNPIVINIVRFLMTIDDDNDPSNGIQITTAVLNAATGQSLDFTLDISAFGSDSNVLNVIALLTAATSSGASPLVSEQVAQNHLNNTIMSNFSGIYNGTFSGGYQGTWTIVVNTNGTITGSGCNTSNQSEFLIAGTASSSGESSLGFAGDGEFTGNFNIMGEFSGTWTADSGSTSGTFTGSKASSSSGGTCPTGGTPPPPPPPGSGDSTPPSGSIAITGTDTSIIGTTYSPVYDDDSFEVAGFVTNAILYDVNLYTATVGTEIRVLVMQFSATDDSPYVVGLTKTTGGSPDQATYIANCISGDDCSGVSFNRSTMTVTFTDALLLPDSSVSGNLATDNITISGTITFSIPAAP